MLCFCFGSLFWVRELFWLVIISVMNFDVFIVWISVISLWNSCSVKEIDCNGMNILRTDDNDWVQKCVILGVEGPGQRNRSTKTGKDIVDKDISDLHINWLMLEENDFGELGDRSSDSDVHCTISLRFWDQFTQVNLDLRAIKWVCRFCSVLTGTVNCMYRHSK